MRCSGVACLLAELWLVSFTKKTLQRVLGEALSTTLFPLVSALGLGLGGVGILACRSTPGLVKAGPGGVVSKLHQENTTKSVR